MSRIEQVISVLLALIGLVSGAVASDDAAFVDQNVPTCMVTGRSYAVSVTMLNTGDSSWSGASGYVLGTADVGSDQIWGLTMTPLRFDDIVEPGLRRTFVFTIRAPSTPGTHEFKWQMGRGPLHRFGAPTPGVMVNVTDTPDDGNDAEFLAQMIAGILDPEVLIVSPGQRFYATIAMLNTGTSTWSRSRGHSLISENPARNTLWGRDRIDLEPIESLPASGYREFGAWLIAPEEEGEYDLQWRMAELESSEREFGEFTKNVKITVWAGKHSEKGAEPVGPPLINGVAHTRAVKLPCGQPFTLSIRMKNAGQTTWENTGSPMITLGSVEDNPAWGVTRIDLKPGEIVPPGATKTFRANLVAPDKGGTYVLQWQLLEEQREWFGEPTPLVKVVVTGCTMAACTSSCPGADPNDEIPDTQALQDCINSQKTVELCPGTKGYIVTCPNPRYPNPLCGLEIMKGDQTLTSAIGDKNDRRTWAIIVAKDDLWAFVDDPIESKRRGGMIRAYGKSNVTLRYLVINGNKSGRSSGSSSPAHSCVGDNRLGGTTLHFQNCHGLSLTYLDVKNTLCGTAIGTTNGSNITIKNVQVKDSGFQCSLPSIDAAYSDGMTLTSAGNTIKHNVVEDFSDCGIVSGGGSNTIQNNTIQQSGMSGGTGIALVNFGGTSPGNHTGTSVTGNTISSSSSKRMDFGLVLGPHPWNSSQTSSGGTIESNTIRNAMRNLVVDGHNNAVVCRNTVSGAGWISSCWFGACQDQDYAVAHSSGCTLQSGFGPTNYYYYHDGGTACGDAPRPSFSRCATSSAKLDDITAPFIELTERYAMSRSGVREIVADAWDIESGVDSVEIWIDGVMRTTLYSYPYKYAWDTNEELAGTHEIRVRAFNGSGVVTETILHTQS